MNFNKVYTIDDLVKLGTVEEIIRELNESMTPYVVAGDVTTYELLLPYVKRAKQTERFVPTEFFVSRKHELIYILTQHGDGKERKQKLGCKDKYFKKENRREASKWYRDIANSLEAESKTNAPSDDIIKQAFQKLTALRERFSYKFESMKEQEFEDET